ncbi:MAG: TMEM165/GDT1 family protein [Acidimicrobiales bacterium]
MALILLAFGVIFVAELGDKSQLMALAFATRYRAVPILIGITIATALVHAVSVGIGAMLGATLPTRAITIVAALAFFGFAAWTLRGDELTDEEEAKVDRSSRSAIVAASVAFFLAELGDKTMLATITLATTGNPFAVWLGSTLGMVAADALAIVVGQQLGARLPERAVRIGAAVAFFAFGVILLVEALVS